MHVRCPHCQNPIEVVDGNPLTDVSCPSCGSNFNLISGETASHTPGAVRTIGHFELLESVGGGHFGTVWKARDTKLDRVVAVKIPRRGQIEGPEAEMFMREARAAAQVMHPGVVGVYEVGRDDETLYIVSDFIDGCDLKQWLSGRRLTPREAAELCRKIAEALHVAHEAGVIHRDLKPGNVMMDMAGQPHLTDFGLAKREAGEITMTVDGQVLGTPAYMSPEQARGEAHEADRRSDIYSLGVILFELLTGEIPFRGNQRMMVVQILQDEPPSPRKLQTQIPRDLETICLKCLEKAPAKRFQTVAELAAELGRFLRGEPIEARPLSRLEHAWRWASQNALVSVLAVALFAALMSGLIGIAAQWIRAEGESSRAQLNEQIANQKKSEAETEKQLALEQRDIAVRNRYLASVRLAQQDMAAGQMNRVQEYLNEFPFLPKFARTDYRGWEWYYFLAQCHGDLRTLDGHVAQTRFVGWSHDGRRFASAGGFTVKIWDWEHGRLIHSLQGHTAEVFTAAWSPDSTRLASGSADRTIKIWDVNTGKVVRTLATEEVPHEIAWSPDGKHLATGCHAGRENLVTIWDVGAGQKVHVLRGHSGEVWCVAWSPDGRRLASGSCDKTIKIWDMNDPHELLKLQGHEGYIYRLAWSPDGERLASASVDQTIKIWNTRSGEIVSDRKAHAGGVDALAWSPDGRRLVSGGRDSLLKVWDASSGKELLSIRGHRDTVFSVAWHADSRLVASGSMDGFIKIWDAGRNVEGITLGESSMPILSLAWNPSGQRLASAGSDDVVTIWDVQTGKEVRRLPAPKSDRHSLAWDHSGTRLAIATSDGKVTIWNPTTGQQVSTFSAAMTAVHTVVWSADGRRLGLCGASFQIVDAVKGQQLFNLARRPDLTYAWSPEANRVASHLFGSQLEISDATTGAITDTFQDHFVTRAAEGTPAAWRPDGNCVAHGAGNAGDVVFVRDLAQGNLKFVLRGHTGEVKYVSWSPDGHRLASTGTDETVRIWDTETGQEIMSLVTHAGVHHYVAWSPNGQRLASASDNGTIKIWNASFGYELASRPTYCEEGAHRERLYRATRPEIETSIPALEELIAESPLDFDYRCALREIYLNLAKRSLENGKFGQALAGFNKAARIAPVFSDNMRDAVPSLAAYCDTQMLEADRIVGEATKANTLRPEHAALWEAVGMLQFCSENWTESKKYLEKSIRMGDSASACFHLAMVHQRLGDRENARKCYDMAVQRMDADGQKNVDLSVLCEEASKLLDLSGNQPEHALGHRKKPR